MVGVKRVELGFKREKYKTSCVFECTLIILDFSKYKVSSDPDDF